MAVRASLAWIQVWPEITDFTGSPLFQYQNHFHPSRTLYASANVPYNSFTVSPILIDKNNTSTEVSVSFAATADNVDLVQNSIQNKYTYVILILRWAGAVLNNPPAVIPVFAFFDGTALRGEADVTTVTVTLGKYSSATNADFPWRKIPWTILGPLALRS